MKRPGDHSVGTELSFGAASMASFGRNERLPRQARTKCVVAIDTDLSP